MASLSFLLFRFLLDRFLLIRFSESARLSVVALCSVGAIPDRRMSVGASILFTAPNLRVFFAADFPISFSRSESTLSVYCASTSSRS